MTVTHETCDSNTHQGGGNHQANDSKRQHMAERAREKNCDRDRHRMTDGEWAEGSTHRAESLNLKPARDSEEPTHCRIDPMRSAEREEHEPGVRRIVDRHSA